MTPDQMRMARAKLDLSQGQVAADIGITLKTLSNAERGSNSLSSTNMDKLRLFYTSRGIDFTEHDGVRSIPSGLRTYKGNAGFREFYDELYETAKTVGGDLCLFNGVSGLVVNALGPEHVALQKDRMSKIRNNYTYRVILGQGDDTFFGADYCQYRWIEKDISNDKSIFVFGSKVAFALFEDNDVEVVVVDNAEIANSQRILFDLAWENIAEDPNENE